ncbi:Gfo/Idh/MocA family oxidoreductase [Candidatus Villigracilis saccharophilus]|uniref:Gfo/Idh/MocA family oxidoreductase n=1 Tax=Candidatus Villigracilis saccharophilus TaxID=3140684 RepID=UPI003135C5D6|nr:Gfo/Idh/MocA family oxidoreductase [Anaerolineales bacterium]
MPKNFAVIGVGGYIAPRHLRAIRDTGNQLVAAVDPKDSVGVLDQYSFDVKFFTEIERFDRHLEKLRRGPMEDRVHFVSVCSPNYLHDSHCRLALRVGADVICEKPLVINPWNFDALEELESETKHHIHTILQLRVHPELIKLKQTLQEQGGQHDVELTYITSRGPWYQVSWKGHEDKSGGVATNIGVHFFDLLLWLFGSTHGIKVYHSDESRMSGFIELEHARVRWFLSVDKNDLPFSAKAGGKTTFRSITVDGKEIEFSEGFTDLHTRVYEETLAGRGFGIKDARPSIDLTYAIRSAEISPKDELIHPLLKK